MRVFLFLLAAAAVSASPVFGDEDGALLGQKPVVMNVTLGSPENPMRFVPAQLEFRVGKLYKLFIKNGSTVFHEFDAPEFVERVYSLKTEVYDKEGDKVAEVYGTPREIEMGPGVTVEWVFLVVRAGENLALMCDLPGHKEAGMMGTISAR